MGLTTVKELLGQAQKGRYAVPAFNVENMETLQGVVIAAKEMKMPVIIQTTPSSVAYAGLDFFVQALLAELKDSTVQIALHLDHGSSYELAAHAMQAGYTSVMIDGSKLNLEENIRLSRSVADLAHLFGKSVEAELGNIGGKEDGAFSKNIALTEVEHAIRFTEETGIDSLAVAIGTVHGFYQGEPKIDISRLKEIHNVVSIPLVLHGTSGLGAEIVRECIRNGICKVNYATDLREAFTKAVKSAIMENPDEVDPKKYLGRGRAAVTEVAKARMELCHF